MQCFLQVLQIVNCLCLIVLYDYNEKQKVVELVVLVVEIDIVVMSDVGMLIVSDFGYGLVVEVVVQGVMVIVILGFSVVLMVFVIFGLFIDCFIFEGFLFCKLGDCCLMLCVFVVELCMMVFFELLFCFVSVLVDIGVVFGEDCWIVVCCELIKFYEEVC